MDSGFLALIEILKDFGDDKKRRTHTNRVSASEKQRTHIGCLARNNIGTQQNGLWRTTMFVCVFFKTTGRGDIVLLDTGEVGANIGLCRHNGFTYKKHPPPMTLQ